MSRHEAPPLEGLVRELRRELGMLQRQCAQVRRGAQSLRSRDAAARVALEVYRRELPAAVADALGEITGAPDADDLVAWAAAQERLAQQASARALRLLEALGLAPPRPRGPVGS